eukprot:1786238-Amphidinium_carterae.1
MEVSCDLSLLLPALVALVFALPSASLRFKCGVLSLNNDGPQSLGEAVHRVIFRSQSWQHARKAADTILCSGEAWHFLRCVVQLTRKSAIQWNLHLEQEEIVYPFTYALGAHELPERLTLSALSKTPVIRPPSTVEQIQQPCAHLVLTGQGTQTTFDRAIELAQWGVPSLGSFESLYAVSPSSAASSPS